MATSGSIWNPDNIRDVAEAVGVAALTSDATDHLTRDVEFRVALVLRQALKFMRHSKRTVLHTADISNALRVLDIEPLYGYESTRPLKFGEASIGPGQPLYYIEDEEVDFEKLINAPLPRVPREMTFTAHWLAVEGVQPSIPQNPVQGDAGAGAQAQRDLLPKGPNANPHLAAAAGVADNNTNAAKPLVKHVLSKELQLYFEHVCAALLDETNAEYRNAALLSLREDPGIHQLVPYFVNYVFDKVTHNYKNIFILTQMLLLLSSLLDNPNLYLSPYINQFVPPIMTCLVGTRLGTSPSSSSSSALFTPATPSNLPDHYPLRDLASSLLTSLTRAPYTAQTPSLKPRLARTLVKHLLAPTLQPLGSYYGAVRGLSTVAGADGVRALLLPNLPALDGVIREVVEKAEEGEERKRKEAEAETVVNAVCAGLGLLDGEAGRRVEAGGSTDHMEDVTPNGAAAITPAEKEALADKVGAAVAQRLLELARAGVVRAVLADDAVP